MGYGVDVGRTGDALDGAADDGRAAVAAVGPHGGGVGRVAGGVWWVGRRQAPAGHAFAAPGDHALAAGGRVESRRAIRFTFVFFPISTGARMRSGISARNAHQSQRRKNTSSAESRNLNKGGR